MFHVKRWIEQNGRDRKRADHVGGVRSAAAGADRRGATSAPIR